MLPPTFPIDDKVTFGKPSILVVDNKGNFIQINVGEEKPALISVVIKEHKLDKMT